MKNLNPPSEGFYSLKNRPTLVASRIVFRFLFPFLGGVRITGKDLIPKSGPVLICPNHLCDLDPVAVLTAVDRNDLNALAKSELFKVPVLTNYFWAIGAIPVKRDTADRGALRISEEILNAGRMLLVFPEGRCAQNGKLQNLQPGAAMLSLKTGAPIVPMGLRGTNKVLRYGTVFPKFSGSGVNVTVGKPICPADYKHLPHKAALLAMTADLRAELARLTSQE
jgi:1-acyl-sn-glycerol-3-phosphate acyltransferase